MDLFHSLNGASLVTFITCRVEWVQPSLQDSKEKMSWYSARREWAEYASSSDQDPRLLKSNFSNSFSCLCSMVILGVWMPCTPANMSIMPGCFCALGTWLGAITPTTGIFFRVLRVSHTIPYHDGDTFAAIAHLSVGILYCQTSGQQPFLSMHCLSHHIQPHSGECSLHPCMYDFGWQGIYHFAPFGGDDFIIFSRVQHFSGSLVVLYCGSGLSYHQKVGYPGIDPRCC